MRIDEKEEKNAVDYLRDAKLSISFLEVASRNIHLNPNSDKLSVRELFQRFVKEVGGSSQFVPLNPGILIAYLYMGFLFTKEVWFDLVPNTPMSQLDENWGIPGIDIRKCKHSDPPLKQVVRHIRNALGHYNLQVSFDKSQPGDAMMKTFITFRDEFNADDQFEARVSIHSLLIFINNFHFTLFEHVTKKYGL